MTPRISKCLSEPGDRSPGRRRRAGVFLLLALLALLAGLSLAQAQASQGVAVPAGQGSIRPG